MFPETKLAYAVGDTTAPYAKTQAINKNVGTYGVLEVPPTYTETGVQYQQKGLKP